MDIVPPRASDVGHFEAHRPYLLVLPKSMRPAWFKDRQELMLVPLFWKDDIDLSESRTLEAILLCNVEEPKDPNEWNINPTEIMTEAKTIKNPEDDRYSQFIHTTKLVSNKKETKLYCSGMVRALCDQQRRVRLTQHSLGLVIWSYAAFSEYFGA